MKTSSSNVSSNLHRVASLVSTEERERKFGQRAVTIWFTGLSGAGKSTLARELEKKLFDEGKAVYVLDGDNVRQGLNKNLGFSPEDRSENIRRVAETARLFNDAGIIVICAFITPLEEYRKLAKEVVGEERYREVYLSTPLEACEERDPNGLYKKARSGEIPNFTGISAPYEEPRNPHLKIDTSKESISNILQELQSSVDVLGFRKQ